MPITLVVGPLLGVLILNLFGKKAMNGLAFTLACAIAIAQIALVLAFPGFWTAGAGFLTEIFGWDAGVDSLAKVMFLAIPLVTATALMVGRQVIGGADRFFLFANLTILAMAGMNGIVLANDLFTIYVFLEVTAVASYILISFGRGRDALEGAFKYLLLSSVATAMLLTAIGLMISIAGGTSFALISDALKSQPNHLYAQLSLALFVAGLFIKSGLVPFHGWLPGAYSEAPSPVSVLLAGIITKTTGVYTLVRLVITVFGPHPTTQGLLLAFGAISIVVGAIAALTQNDFKRMLAYSSISQVGYIILGLGGGTEIAIAGAVLHLFNHAVFKTLLFVNASAVEQQTKTRDMNRLGGLSNRMPVTGTTSTIAFLSTAGIPPFSGFWSKLLIIVGVWKAGFPGYAILGIAASLLTLAYFLAMQRKMFFGKLMIGFEDLKEAGAWITIPAILLAALTFGLGVAAPWLFETFIIPIRSIL